MGTLALRLSALARRGLAILVLTALCAGAAVAAGQDQAEALSGHDAEILSLVNAHRASLGLGSMTEYAPLSAASLAWSQHLIGTMPANQCPFHLLVHDTGTNIATQGQVPGTTTSGENLACSVGPPGFKFPITWTYNNMPAVCASPIDYASPLMQFCQWIDSTDHRMAIENTSYTYIGLGSVVNVNGGSNHQVTTARFSNAPKLASSYQPVNPTRLLDSRDTNTPWGQGEKRSVNVTGVGPIPATGVDAVVLNITTVSPSANFSWLTISPTGEAPSTTAAHNFGTAWWSTELLNDLVMSKVGSGGTVDITNTYGSVHLVIDVVGYYSTGGYGYQPVTPARLLDSRTTASPWTQGELRQVDVTGVGGVPASGVQAVALNVTTVSPTAAISWLTISPTGEAASSTAAHNFGTAAYTTELSNDLVIAKVGAGGTIDIRNALGNVHLVIDVVGYYASAGGSDYQPSNPKRILDTRNSTQGAYSTPWTAGLTRTIDTTFGSCAKAVVVNITTVSPSADFSWLTLSTPGAAVGTTAAVTFGNAAFTSNVTNDLVIAPTDANGDFAITNYAGNVHLVIDLVGVYGTC